MMKKITWSLAIGLFAGMNLNGYSQVLVEDAAFGTEGLVQWGIGDALEHSNEVGQILEQPDGKIIFGGMNESAGSFYFTVARMLEDGTPDNAFGTNGVTMHQLIDGEDCFLFDLELQADGKILACGFTSDGMSTQAAVVRYKTNGTIDSTFATNGIFLQDLDPMTMEYATAIEVLSDGKILVGGINADFMTDADLFVTRLNDNGTLDNTFNGTGYTVVNQDGSQEFVIRMEVQADSKIVLAGYSFVDGVTDEDVLVVRLDENGVPDDAFGTNGFVVMPLGDTDDEVTDLAIQTDGKILVTVNAAFNTDIDVEYDFALVRLNTDGTPDGGFGTGGIVLTDFDGTETQDEYSNTLAIDENDKIVVGGFISTDMGETIALLRYNADGTLDTGFDEDGFFTEDYGFNQTAFSLAIQEDEKILAMGMIQSDAGSDFSIARYKLVDDAGMDNAESAITAEIYPNPTTGVVKISVAQESDIQKLEVLNMAGQVVYEQTLINASQRNFELDLTAEKEGVYLVRITGAESFETLRFVKTAGY